MIKIKEAENSKNSFDQKYCFNYYGEVTIKNMYDDLVLSVYKNHNEGTNLLFTALCNAVAGTLTANLLPKYLKLYGLCKNEDTDIPDGSWFEGEVWSNTNYESTVHKFYACTGKIALATPPLVSATEGSVPKTTFQFSIPYSQIENAQEGEQAKPCLLALFSEKELKKESPRPLAYFIIRADSNENTFGEISLAGTSDAHFSLKIDWDMFFGNT